MEPKARAFRRNDIVMDRASGMTGKVSSARGRYLLVSPYVLPEFPEMVLTYEIGYSKVTAHQHLVYVRHQWPRRKKASRPRMPNVNIMRFTQLALPLTTG